MKRTRGDLHIVIEARRLTDGTLAYIAATPEVPWDVAQTEWARLDDPRLNPRIDGRYERFYMVRCATDPRWEFLGRPKPRTTTQGGHHAGRDLAAKDYGRDHGVSGRSGGWIMAPNNTPIAHGWAEYSSKLSRDGRIRQVLVEGRTVWFALPDIFMCEPEGVAA